MVVQRPCPGGRYPAIHILIFGGMLRVCLNRWRTSRGKKRPVRRRFRCSITTVVLNAKSAMELARDCGIGMSTLPAIRSFMAGCACCDSMSLIQPLLHCSHTTFAVQFSSLADQFFLLSMFKNFFSPGNNAFIHWLHTCSPESLAVDGQKAHASGMWYFTALASRRFWAVCAVAGSLICDGTGNNMASTQRFSSCRHSRTCISW